MAEAFVNHLAPEGTRAERAGTRPAERIHPDTVRVMQEVGVDLSAQKPKPLTDAMAENALRVITMGCGAEVCPSVPSQKTEIWSVEDPTGGTIGQFRDVRDAIRGKVAALVQQIKQ